MRTLLPLSLAAALFLAAGCGPRPEAPAPDPDAKILTFWHIITYTDVLDQAVARFEQAHPGVEVRVQTIPNDQYKTKLNVELASGTPPDVFFTWGGGGLAELAEAGRVLDLTDAATQGGWKDTFLPAALDFCTVGDSIYAVPLDLSSVPVWYNAAMFEEHGIEPPATFDELVAAAQKLRAQGVAPFALGNRARWPGAFYFIYLATRLGGRELFEAAADRRPGYSFADPAFVRAGEMLREMVDGRFFPTGFNGIEDDAARTRFLNGQAAMYLMGTWFVARVLDEKPEFVESLRCFPFPPVEGGAGDPRTVLGGVNAGFAVSSTCKEPELAVALLRELTSDTTAREWAAIGRIPAVKVDEDALAALPAPTREALEILQSATAIQQYYDQYLPPRLGEAHKNTTHALFAGTLSPEDAAERMERAAAEEAQ